MSNEEMKSPDTENRLGKIANAIVIAMLGFNMVVIFLSFQVTIESYGLLEAFESDGSYLAWLVQQNIQNGTFSPHGFFNYGFAYHSTAIAIGRILNFFGFVVNDFRAAANILLIINLASYCGIVLVFKKILNVFKISLWIKTLSLLFFIQIPAVVWFTGTIHPDLLLGFFSILSVYFFLRYALFERNRLLNLVVSFFVLGVAFGVKYTALMYAPVLGCFVIYRCIKYSDKWFVEVLKLGSISVLCFLLGWLIFNPYVILDFRHFYYAFVAELEHVSYGKGVNVGIPDGASPLLWMPVILKELTLIGWVLLATGVIVSIFFLIKKGNDKSMGWLVLLLFLFPFSFLLFIVRDRAPWYFMSLFPFGILASALGYDQLRDKWSAFVASGRKNLAKSVSVCYAIVVIFLGVLIIVRYPYDGLMEIQNRKIQRRVSDGNSIFAYLLNKENVRILAGQYSYIDDKIRPLTTTSWFYLGFDPEPYTVVILNLSIPGRFIWKEPGTSFKDGKVSKIAGGDFSALFQQYQKLVDDESWEVKYESNETVLLVKKDSLHEKLYHAPKDFLVNAVEVGSANDFHVFYDNTTHKLKIQKVNFTPGDCAHKFMVETMLDENGDNKRIDDGFDLNRRMLIQIGADAFFEYSLPKGKIKDVRVGQYYFDGTWKYPWQVKVEGSQLIPN